MYIAIKIKFVDLLELSKNDSVWRKIAYSICKNYELADDLVQEMYIKIYDINPEKVNKAYVSYCMYHIFLAHVKDEQKKISLNKIILNDTLNEDNETLKERMEMTKALKEIPLYDCEILLHTCENSLRKKSKELNISVDKLFYGKKKAFKKLLNTKTIKQSLKDKNK